MFELNDGSINPLVWFGVALALIGLVCIGIALFSVITLFLDSRRRTLRIKQIADEFKHE